MFPSSGFKICHRLDRGNMRVIIAAAVLSTATSEGANWTAYRLPEAIKPPQSAMCLDGSPPLYYVSPGSGEGVNKWEIHMVRQVCGDSDSLPAYRKAARGAPMLLSV